MINIFTYAFITAATGFLVGHVLTKPGEILDWWPDAVHKALGLRSNNPNDWPEWKYKLTKVTYLCGKCISGQLSVLAGIFFFLVCGFSVGQCYSYVVLSVFFTWVMQWMTDE